MTDISTGVNGWEQTRLINPDVFQITLQIGLLPPENHYQWQIEVENPVSGELLACWSRPHFNLDAMPTEIAAMVEALRAWIDVATDPFRTL